MSGCGRKALSDVREWSEGTPGCTGVVGWPSGCLGVVRRPSRMSWSGREALPDVRMCFPTIPGYSGERLDHYRTSGRASRPIPDIR